MKISVVAFEASTGIDLVAQAENCLVQLNDFISGNSISLKNVISINFFVSAGSNGDYCRQADRLMASLPSDIKNNIPVTLLAQAPANGSGISAEIYYVEKTYNAAFTPKTEEGQLYLSIEGRDGDKLVIASGIGQFTKITDVTSDAERVFSTMEKILKAEGLDFCHIFRQWNYIEGITAQDDQDGSVNQHYQLFNNVRSAYYSRSEFKHGYPAATGIGVSAGGVIVSFFAASDTGYAVSSLENPLQKAAFEYTEEVLVGTTEYRGCTKCTPKFSRAKLVANTESEQVFISGTAAIRDQLTVGEKDVSLQTQITLENIQKLICGETLAVHKRKSDNLPEIRFIRVYIKYQEDYPVVRQVCEKYLPGIQALYVVSDVCRDNLLVEIEALAS